MKPEFYVDGVRIQAWYEEGYVDPSDRDEPVVRPYLLRINGDMPQAFTTDEKRQSYLDWWVKLRSKRKGQS